MKLHMSSKIRDKITSIHGLCEKEVHEAFENLSGGIFEDVREEHKTDPPSYYFVSENDKGKAIKVVFMVIENGESNEIHLKSAYYAGDRDIRHYERINERS